jgi:DNA topoisomerase-1
MCPASAADLAHKRPRTQPTPPAELLLDSTLSAKAAGLRYVYDTRPGIARKRSGKGFRYIDPNGHPVRDKETLARIKSLVIPPAWTSVWICPIPNGHLQATGRDARGRKQSRYHPRWREVRDEAKYEHMLRFGEALPTIRERVADDLARPGLPREKVIATIVRLLETTFIRIGNPEYARDNHSYGLTTLRRKHVEIDGATLTFHFTGKSGVEHTVNLTDRKLARIVKACHDTPGYELFEYLDADGNPHTVCSTDVNDYLNQITGQHFTAKDFRTWAGTVLACLMLRDFEACDSQTQLKKNVVEAIKSVSQRLGNTPSVCRKCYVHPAVLESYLNGAMTQPAASVTADSKSQQCSSATNALRPEESALMHLLQQQLNLAA